jgi:hypothetical protein
MAEGSKNHEIVPKNNSGHGVLAGLFEIKNIFTSLRVAQSPVVSGVTSTYFYEGHKKRV